MLSDLEKKRLEEREARNMSPRVRAANDDRAKKKLRQWLNDAPDVIQILNSIPGDRLTDHLIDSDVYRLLTIVQHIMAVKRFMAVSGKLEYPAGWTAKGYGITRPADSIDILRSVLIDNDIKELECFVGINNPAVTAAFVHKLATTFKDSEFMRKPTAEEEKGIKRYLDTVDEYIKNQLESEQAG